MKKLSMSFALLFVAAFTFAQTTVKTFDPAGATSIKLDFKYKKADDKKWDNETIRIQMEIHTNMPETVMKQLVKAGRYNLEGTRVGDEFVITCANLEKNVTVGGVSLDDQIFVHIDCPVWIDLSKETLTIASRAMDKNIKTKIDIADIVFVYNDKTASNDLKNKVTKKQKNETKHGIGNPPTGGDPNMEMKAQFGEILIDGVIWEVE